MEMGLKRETLEKQGRLREEAGAFGRRGYFQRTGIVFGNEGRRHSWRDGCAGVPAFHAKSISQFSRTVQWIAAGLEIRYNKLRKLERG